MCQLARFGGVDKGKSVQQEGGAIFNLCEQTMFMIGMPSSARCCRKWSTRIYLAVVERGGRGGGGERALHTHR